jgi:hypothetical protein
MKFIRLLYITLMLIVMIAMFAMPFIYVAIRLRHDH